MQRFRSDPSSSVPVVPATLTGPARRRCDIVVGAVAVSEDVENGAVFDVHCVLVATLLVLGDEVDAHVGE